MLHYDYSMGYGFGGFWMLLFWILVITGLAFLVKWLVQANTNNDSSDSAIDILKRRYAKGEIGEKEFEAKKKDLLD